MDFEIREQPALKKKADKHIVLGVVYEPDVRDTDGNFMTAEEIEKMAYRFMEELRNTAIDREHNGETGGCGTVVESFIAREGGLGRFPAPVMCQHRRRVERGLRGLIPAPNNTAHVVSLLLASAVMPILGKIEVYMSLATPRARCDASRSVCGCEAASSYSPRP